MWAEQVESLGWYTMPANLNKFEHMGVPSQIVLVTYQVPGII